MHGLEHGPTSVGVRKPHGGGHLTLEVGVRCLELVDLDDERIRHEPDEPAPVGVGVSRGLALPARGQVGERHPQLASLAGVEAMHSQVIPDRTLHRATASGSTKVAARSRRPRSGTACWRSFGRSPSIPKTCGRNLSYGAAMTTAATTTDPTPEDRPWEPPVAGTEAQHLAAALDRLRATFRWKADGLDSAGLQTRIGASTLTLGGLLKHLALVEDHYFTGRLGGGALGAPWDAVDWEADPSWEFTSAAADGPAELYALYDAAVHRSRGRLADALADGGLDQLIDMSWPDGRRASLRRMLCDLLEEYGRHTGHADLLREAVDGRVGEDPPAGWRP